MFTDEMRPQTLEEMAGNDVIKAVIGGQIADGNISHTILLTGSFGTGKTTVARIIGNAINAEVEEINCGSQTGIDMIRVITENQNLSPLMGDTRLYILDEIHSLTKQAQQALLKTAEEPSSSSYFIFCTTDPSKLDEGLRTRSLSLETQSLTDVDPEQLRFAVTRLLAKKPELKFEDKKDLNVILENSGSSYRDLYNNFEKLYSATRPDNKGIRLVTSATVKLIVGTSYAEREARNEGITNAFLRKNLMEALEIIKTCEKEKLNCYSAMLGVYRYLKAVYMKKGKFTSESQSFLAELGMLIAEYALTWTHVEAFAFKYCR